MSQTTQALISQLTNPDKAIRQAAMDALTQPQHRDGIPYLIDMLKKEDPIFVNERDKDNYHEALWERTKWHGLRHKDVAREVLKAIGEPVIPIMLSMIRMQPTSFHYPKVAYLKQVAVLDDVSALVANYRGMLLKNPIYPPKLRYLIEKHDPSALDSVADLVPQMLKKIEQHPTSEWREFMVHLQKWADESAVPLLVEHYRASLKIQAKPEFGTDTYHRDLLNLIKRLGTQRDVRKAAFPPLQRWIARVGFQFTPWIAGGIGVAIFGIILWQFGIQWLCLSLCSISFLIFIALVSLPKPKRRTYSHRGQSQTQRTARYLNLQTKLYDQRKKKKRSD